MFPVRAQDMLEDSLQHLIQTFTDRQDSLQLSRAMVELGYHYQRKGAFDKAGSMLAHAIPWTHSKRRLADIYTDIGLNHYYLGEYEQATNYHLKNLRLSEEIEYTLGQIKGSNNLGIIAIRLKDWKEAEKQHQRSLSLSEAAGNEAGIAHNLGNLALIYQAQNKIKQAIDIQKRSLKLFKQQNRSQEISRALNNLGKSYGSLERYDSALHYYQASLNAYEANEDRHGISETLPNIAFCFRKQGNFQLAERYMKQAISLVDSTQSKEARQLVYQGFAELYADWGKYERAYAYRLLYEQWTDTVIGERHLNNIKELELKYESEKKQKELLTLETRTLAQAREIASKNFWLWIIGLLALLTMVAGGLLSLLMRQRLRFAKEKAGFESMIHTEEAERKRIAQNLHDSIGSLLAVIKNQLSAFVSQSKSLDSLLPLVSDACEEVRRISHDLSPKVLEEYGLESALQNLIDHTKAGSPIHIQLHTYGLQDRLTPLTEVLLYRIIQELIHNSLKHAHASKIDIHLTRHPDSLNLVVEDNGRGLSRQESGTSGGMGLDNIKARVSQLQGTVQIDSLPNKGFSILIDLPL